MKIALFHLSDIHFRETDNFVSARAGSIAAALWSNAVGTDRQYFLITGDIAFSGRAEEYANARSFFELLQKAGSKYLAAPNPRFLIIPGNHDCDLRGDQEVRSLILKSDVMELAQKAPSSGLLRSPQLRILQ
jgi:predicted MPP superfamily phosphohydrolase